MALCERGDDVVVLSRGPEAARSHLGAKPACCRGAGKVELATWTPEKAGDWSRKVDGADAIVHLAGAGVMDEPWTPERKEVLRSSRIRSTELLAEAIARADKKPRVFVSGSAVGYYGIRTGDAILTEDSPPGDDFLARLVVDWEAAAAPARTAGVRVCHPRIGLVVGRGGGMMEKMLPAFRAFVGGPVGTGAQYMGWIHIVDTVRALEHALDTALDGPFNVTDYNGHGAVLCATLAADGNVRDAVVRSTRQREAGLVEADTSHLGARDIADLTRSDFPGSGARISRTGEVAPRP